MGIVIQKQKQPLLSVAIITKNEAGNIERCIQSVQWANEIIVVDAESTDNTREIASALGATVYIQKWLGFGPQKNKAIELCHGRWVLVLDADEVISETLKASILNAINLDMTVVYRIRRRSSFCGQWIRFSAGIDLDEPVLLP